MRQAEDTNVPNRESNLPGTRIPRARIVRPANSHVCYNSYRPFSQSLQKLKCPETVWSPGLLPA
jgi:hypothetical protein